MSLEQLYSNTGVWTLKDQRIFGPSLDGYQSANFSSSNSYLTLTGPVIGSNNFTFEFWYYPLELQASRALFSLGTTDISGSLVFYTTANGTSTTLWASQGTRTSSYAASVNFTANTWHHVALTKQGANTYVHINGALNVQGYSDFTPSNTEFQINRGYATPVQGNISYFNNFRLVIGDALYTNTTIAIPVAPPGVYANVYLLTCHSRTFKDSSSRNATITANNASISRVAPFLPHPYPNTGISSIKNNFQARMANTWPRFSPILVEALIVGGGGPGASESAGGGGAGGLLYYGEESPKTPNGPRLSLEKNVVYTITVGAGGAHQTLSSGSNSSFIGGAYNLQARGGGAGYKTNGSNGGSGGGGGPNGGTGGTGESGQGFAGGNGATYSAGGGGGAGGAGQPGTTNTSVQGGAGGNSLIYTIATGANSYYAGGGAGAPYNAPGGTVASYGAPGGLYSGGGSEPGGGSASGTQSNTGAPNTYGTGVINTGGGGGSIVTPFNGYYGYAGGSGVVVIRAAQPALRTTGAPTLNSNNGLYSYVFTGSGTIVF